MSYLITETLTSTIACYMIVKRLLRPFTEWQAYKHGIIDANGKRLRKPRNAKEREGWDILDRLCWSIKRMLHRFGGDNKWVYLFSAAYLMKEQAGYVFSQNMEKYKPELEDLTCEKQLILKQLFMYMESEGLLKESKLDLETNILKLYTPVQELVGFHTISCTLFEEEGVAAMGGGSTALGDIAQFTPVITPTKRINKDRIKRRSLLLRTKKGKLYVNNN